MGEHNLLRLSNGDWNDGVVIEFVPERYQDEVTRSGESLLNSAMAAYVLARYAELLELAGNQELCARVKKLAEEQREAVASQ